MRLYSGLSISEENAKLSFPSFSLPPIKSCTKNLKYCFGKILYENKYKSFECYAIKAYRLYPKTKKAWDENLKIVKRQKNWELGIQNYISTKKLKLFRIHSSGDYFTKNYYSKWDDIIKNSPETKFLSYTKNIDLDFKEKPKNHIIKLSMTCLMTEQVKIKFLNKARKENTSLVYAGMKNIYDFIPCPTNGIKHDKKICGEICKLCFDNTKNVFFTIH